MTRPSLLPIKDLRLGFTDAENYRRRENKDFFQRIFFRDEYFFEILQSQRYFVLGEKGTGKTAYAVYMSNFQFENTLSSIYYVRETNYQKFISLRQERQLHLSDFVDIWSVILLLLMSQHVLAKEPVGLLQYPKAAALRASIDEYYASAFAPEVVQAIKFVEGAETAAGIMAKHFQASGKSSSALEYNETRFQINLQYISRRFEEALGSMKLRRDHIIFIDGIDVRPDNIAYRDYIDCIKGLANATWRLNADFFGNIRDSRGRMKVVLLLRPDIFDSLGFQNQNAKARDNAILLNWVTTYADHRGSRLFKLIDGMLGRQQDGHLQSGEAWDYYCPYTIFSISAAQGDPAFLAFLRYSWYRPRDIISFMLFMQKYIVDYRNTALQFSEQDFRSCRKEYSVYFLGEVKDQMRFFYTDEEFQVFLSFFNYLEGKVSFDYHEFIAAHSEFIRSVREEKLPSFARQPDEFLQFMFGMNVLAYRERTEEQRFDHWCFRERSPTVLNPQVRRGVHYYIHYGLTRALNLGKRTDRRI